MNMHLMPNTGTIYTTGTISRTIVVVYGLKKTLTSGKNGGREEHLNLIGMVAVKSKRRQRGATMLSMDQPKWS